MTAAGAPEGGVTVPLFLDGEGMRGGRVHPSTAHHLFLGEASTAHRYRCYVCDGRLSALWPVAEGGVSVPGSSTRSPWRPSATSSCRWSRPSSNWP